MKTGVQIIEDERNRQIEVKRYSLHLDSLQTHASLASAAASYALPLPLKILVKAIWPWDKSYYKPAMPGNANERIHELAKAGALIAAEIDRLQNATNGSEEQKCVK